MVSLLGSLFPELLEVSLQEVFTRGLSEPAGLCRAGSGGFLLSQVGPIAEGVRPVSVEEAER